MKLKVIALSFLITTFLTLNFVVPQLVQEHLQVYMTDIQKSLVGYGLTLNFDDVRMSYIPLKIRIGNLSLVRGEDEIVFSTSKVEFSNWSFSELINVAQGDMSVADLSKLKISLQQLEFNQNYISPRLDSALKELGYEKLILNVVSDYKYDAANKELYLEELSIEGFKMGKINMKVHLKDFAFPSAEEAREMVSLNESSVKFFSVEYTDDSLVKNIKTMADKNNFPLNRYLAFADRIPGTRDPASSEESGITLGLQQFVNDPHSMKLAVTPEKEIPFKDITMMIMLSPTKLMESLQPKLVINGSEIQIYQGN